MACAVRPPGGTFRGGLGSESENEMAEREVGPERATARSEHDDRADTASAPSGLSPVRALQRTAGNHAVSLLIQRSRASSPAAATPAAPAVDGGDGGLSVQRGRNKAKKRKPSGDLDDFVVDDDEDEQVADDEDYDIDLEPPEPFESLEFDNIDPFWRRPGWSGTVKAWVRSELQAGAICPCGLKIKPQLVKAPGQRAKKRRKTGGGGMRVNYDIDHHTIKWADRRSAMEDLKRQGTNITKATLKQVHESKLRLMHASCNVSHLFEPAKVRKFRLVDYDGRPDG